MLLKIEFFDWGVVERSESHNLDYKTYKLNQAFFIVKFGRWFLSDCRVNKIILK